MTHNEKVAIKRLSDIKHYAVYLSVEDRYALDIAIKKIEQDAIPMNVIEDIKADIKGVIEEYDARCERWKPSRYKPTKGIAESNVAPRSPKEIESTKWGERAEGLERALKIIDKHINGKESEELDADSN